MDAVEQAASGHPGMPMGMADVATVLFARHLKFDPACPDWPDRDRFVLSAGHGSMLLYALLHLTGYPDFPIEQLQRFRQLGSRTAGPLPRRAPGIETTTGARAGLANAVGMALAERMLNARFGDSLVSHRTWVIAGDGCMMEGISHEAASLAGHLRLGQLTVLLDDNGISIDGPTSLAMSDDYPARFAALGWHTQSVDGHAWRRSTGHCRRSRGSASLADLFCRTPIDWVPPRRRGHRGAHGRPLGGGRIGVPRALDWPPWRHSRSPAMGRGMLAGGRRDADGRERRLGGPARRCRGSGARPVGASGG